MAGGRPRTFDERVALHAAMEVFWELGYERAGMSTLLSRMQISRQSLYDAFGSKRGLFLRTLEHYRDTQLAEGLALLGREGSPIENVRAVLRFFHQVAIDDRCRGCLVANALLEVGTDDEELAARLHETLGLLEEAVEGALRDARERGELPAHKDPRRVARALTNAMLGMAVSGRLPASRETLGDVYDGTLAMLE